MKNLILPLLLLALAGCASVAPNADPIEVRAEQSISVAADTMDLFIALEYDHQLLIEDKAPEVHQFAEWLRTYIPYPGAPSGQLQRGLVFIQQATDARRTYKALRTIENQNKLTAALAALEQVLNSIQSHLLSAQALTKPGPLTAPAPGLKF
jgi:hypothetical protein